MILVMYNGIYKFSFTLQIMNVPRHWPFGSSHCLFEIVNYCHAYIRPSVTLCDMRAFKSTMTTSELFSIEKNENDKTEENKIMMNNNVT